MLPAHWPRAANAAGRCESAPTPEVIARRQRAAGPATGTVLRIDRDAVQLRRIAN